MSADPSSPPPPGDALHRYLRLIRGQRRGPWPALLRFGLRALAVPYGLAVRLRNLAYQRGWLRVERVAVPVVSVGNLTTGGTGKTPGVEYVAAFYRGRDLRVAILSRGYGAGQGRNDEAMVLEDNLPDVPHLQGPDRAALARAAVDELESEVLVLDDGFQHRRLARDLDVVLLDATCPWGHGYLLPRGLLREPRAGLRRAGVVVLTRCDQVNAEQHQRLRSEVEKAAPGVPVVQAVHQPLELVNGEARAALQELRGRPVGAFCGLGNPEAFRRTLTDLGTDVVAFRAYPDHHLYTRGDVEALAEWAAGLPAEALLVTTQKDLVKLRVAGLADRPLWALRIRLAFLAGQEALDRRLVGVLSERPDAPGGDVPG